MVSVKNPYWEKDNGLLYFEDWNGNDQLCVSSKLCPKIMKECHDVLTAEAHLGYHHMYNQLASVYYWPRMSQDIKHFVVSCDICQKVKLKTHGPLGYLQPIPIPLAPFEVVSMDFITELPKSNDYNAILVIVNKLTKYITIIPTTMGVDDTGTAAIFFSKIVAQYGLPKQIITDRDSRWTGTFWKVICK